MDVNKQMLAALQGYENIVRIVLNGLKRDYEERGLMIRKEFHDELSAALGVACEAVYAAKAAEQAQQAEPVASDAIYEILYGLRISTRHQCREAAEKIAGLYAKPPAQPVARDVLKAALSEMRAAAVEQCNVLPAKSAVTVNDAFKLAYHIKRIDIDAIVDRHAAQPPAVAVPDERAAFEAWLQENIDNTDTVRPSKEKVDAYFAVWLARAMLAAAQKGGA